jgi:hypothetical protein
VRRHHHHRPAKRLLIAPALLLVLLLLGIQQLHTLQPQAVDASLLYDPAALPAVASEPVPCARQDPASVDRARLTPARAGRITSELVLACPVAFDQARVTYVGEVVGDLLRRDGGAWVLINDDDYALEVGPLPGHRDLRGTNSGLTVWLPDGLADAVNGLGRPNQRGDLVQVSGRIVRTDPSDGGGLTLRADQLQVVEPARPVEEPLDLPQLWFALGASLLGATLWLLRRRAVAR